MTLRFAVVAVGPTPGGEGATSLLASSDWGSTFTDIGPAVPKGWEPDSVFFLDPRHGWITTFDVHNLAERLYRTVDGGRNWRSFPAPAHNLAGGSADTLDFVDASNGWLMDTVANAPAGGLYRTRDGGTSWHLVADLRNGTLPQLGSVRFEPDAAVGWLGGGVFGPALYRTLDQGRTWQHTALPTTRDAHVGLPALFGATLLEPVSVRSADSCALRLYRSSDHGQTWALASRLTSAADAANCDPGISTSFPGATTGWATAVHHRRPVVYAWNSRGGGWNTVRAPSLTTTFAPGIAAADAMHAWLVVTGSGENGYRLYRTSDGGQTWQRIDQAAVVAAR